LSLTQKQLAGVSVTTMLYQSCAGAAFQLACSRMTADIRERLKAHPFVPFSIRVADGREYRVPTPDHAHVYPSGGRVSIFTDDDREVILAALLVSGLALDSSAS